MRRAPGRDTGRGAARPAPRSASGRPLLSSTSSARFRRSARESCAAMIRRTSSAAMPLRATTRRTCSRLVAIHHEHAPDQIEAGPGLEQQWDDHDDVRRARGGDGGARALADHRVQDGLELFPGAGVAETPGRASARDRVRRRRRRTRARTAPVSRRSRRRPGRSARARSRRYPPPRRRASRTGSRPPTCPSRCRR